MKNRPVRHRLELLPYLAVSRLLQWLPHEAVCAFGSRLGALGHAVDRRHRRLALDNLQAILPELDAEQRRRTVAACYRHFGRAFCEVFSVARLDAEEIERRFTFTGWEHVEEALADNRGLMLLTGHYGCWQVSIYPLALRLGGLHAVARPPDNPYVARDVIRVRERHGAQIVARAGAGHRVVNLARKGAAIGLVIDQRMPSGSGIRVPFLGRPASTSQVPAIVGRYTGAPAVPVACEPEPGGRYSIRVGPPIRPDVDGDDALEELTSRYLAPIEQDIRRRPELWLWMHDRWRE